MILVKRKGDSRWSLHSFEGSGMSDLNRIIDFSDVDFGGWNYKKAKEMLEQYRAEEKEAADKIMYARDYGMFFKDITNE